MLLFMFLTIVFVAVLRIRYNDEDNEVNLSVEIPELWGSCKGHKFSYEENNKDKDYLQWK